MGMRRDEYVMWMMGTVSVMECIPISPTSHFGMSKSAAEQEGAVERAGEVMWDARPDATVAAAPSPWREVTPCTFRNTTTPAKTIIRPPSNEDCHVVTVGNCR